MCGISAIYRLDREFADEADIRRMCSVIPHRGPDGAGFARMGGGSALLGHVRLSIIDIAAGAQPIFNEDQTIGITFNGEIYDYQAHRDELVRAGHTFRTQSDTEVIIHLYEEHGLKFLEKLNGEFAFVIHDERKRRLIAARDRLGIKPLFFSVLGGRELLLASEAKSILALERVPRALAPDYLVGTHLGAFPYGISAFEGIQSVKPGHYFMAETGFVGEQKPYWEPRFETRDDLSFDEAKVKVRELFVAAVKRRMVADVPVGTYLSGGLDSSLVCATMASLGAADGRPFKAFNVGFKDPRYDESGLARKIAAHFGAEFETIPCGMEDMVGEYEKTIDHLEMALVNPSAIAKQMLSRMVRDQGYKVCITGEGSDEVFGGYPYFKQEAIWRKLLKKDERAEGKALWKRFTEEEKVTEGALWHRGTSWKREKHWFGYPSFHQMRMKESSRKTPRILTKDTIARASFPTPGEIFVNMHDGEKMRGLHPFNATKIVAFSQLSNYIIPTLGDRVEMANSVECRTPFMDRDLVDFVGTVPPEYLLNVGTLREKFLLREAFQGTLPEFISKERKKPFLGEGWYSFTRTKKGAELFGDYTSRDSIKRAGLFKPTIVPSIRLLWKILPEGSVMWKKLDLLAGLIMGTQVLQQRFVERRIESDPAFEMEDRTPGIGRTRERPGLPVRPAWIQAPGMAPSQMEQPRA
jgi:asparagine synthase (glutamine-hydrolysing)